MAARHYEYELRDAFAQFTTGLNKLQHKNIIIDGCHDMFINATLDTSGRHGRKLVDKRKKHAFGYGASINELHSGPINVVVILCRKSLRNTHLKSNTQLLKRTSV